MHRADVHLGQAGHVAELLLDQIEDALFELGRGLVGERERDHVARVNPGQGEDLRDPLGDDLGLARPRAGDDL